MAEARPQPRAQALRDPDAVSVPRNAGTGAATGVTFGASREQVTADPAVKSKVLYQNQVRREQARDEGKDSSEGEAGVEEGDGRTEGQRAGLWYARERSTAQKRVSSPNDFESMPATRPAAGAYGRKPSAGRRKKR